MNIFKAILALAALPLSSARAMAATEVLPPPESGWMGWAVVGLFALAYLFVLLEEKLHFRKSKPVTIAAGLIWILVMIALGARVAPRKAQRSCAIRFWSMRS